MKQARVHINQPVLQQRLFKLNPRAQSFLDGIGWQGRNDVTNDWHRKNVGKDVFPLLAYHAPNFFTALTQGKFSFAS